MMGKVAKYAVKKFPLSLVNSIMQYSSPSPDIPSLKSSPSPDIPSLKWGRQNEEKQGNVTGMKWTNITVIFPYVQQGYW